ncbi:hypothetical protein BGX24_007823 [Mortierella sp. AD032]|nr:hypothetical protein BGX24_007823 [Mortierella sp. AD032]
MFHFLAKCTNLQTLRVSTKHRCPSGLQKLSLHYGGRVKNLYLQEDDEDYDGDSDTKNSGKHEEEKKEPPLFLSAMRELSVTYVSSDGSYPPSWARFLGRCDHLRTLHVSSIDQGWVQALAGLGDLEDLEIDDGNTGNLRLLAIALRVGLPNLNALCINCYEDPDEELASVLLACRAGWRSIELPIMGSHSVNVLIKHHCLTIESLKVSQAPDMSSQQMVQLLASSPCLHTFATLNEEPITDPKVPHFMVEDFVDIDHSTGKARSWLCEPTLKDFRAHITGIPRPDLTKTFHGHPLRNNMVIQEAFPGQGRKLQRLVYERLARFGRLERLQLGHEDRDFNDEFRLMDNNENVEHWDDEVQQNKCLDMSLASGLRALEGLKELKELGIMRMATAVRVEDAQWMAQSWPKLRKLSGLNYSVDVEVEAESWLRETIFEEDDLDAGSTVPTYSDLSVQSGEEFAHEEPKSSKCLCVPKP